ncbi:MAG TPA: ATPase [Pseudomonas xinjiangensis]|uniref:ATPase n=2 Tax=root TaxID=1 RepID=A0A7V1BMB7_9GAMM|nr:ATPase [Halopseudomonas xinjiangensis]HEC49078.1 ATPase [Halopseudomonas xinjiangensis]
MRLHLSVAAMNFQALRSVVAQGGPALERQVHFQSQLARIDMRDRDFEGGLSGIRATDDERPFHATDSDAADRPEAGVRAPLRPEPSSQTSGALWAICGALTLALIGLGYWSHQQQTHLQQQLVATQNSFARISEEAAGRLQVITGKVTATESSMSDVEQTRRALQALETRMAELADLIGGQAQALQRIEQGDETMQEEGAEQRTRLQTLAEQLAALNGRTEAYESNAATLAAQIQPLQAQIEGMAEQLAAIESLEQRLNTLNEQLEAQQQALQTVAAKVSDADVEQELLVLRSDLEQRLASITQELRSVDGFRLQTNRTLTTLQSQIRTLQQDTPQP